ncbi:MULTISPECIES: nucleotide exchange factor GrpE [unclassified Rhodococcus (in: high G+C Gram-positive bacteria)]|uniref:nucleotide exchange factor GrpE n=1 Tax=unclassified Rhodococcus (in: high G+C Gram-positive bacteria) TaxID=192944 RepID=UPI00339616F8
MLALLIIGAAASLAAAFAAGWVLRTHASEPKLDPFAPRRLTPRTEHPAAATTRTVTEAALLAAMIRCHDLGDGVREQIREDLAALGIHLIGADTGSRFDSRFHKAVGSVGADTADQVGMVVALIRPGWSGPNGDVIRFPEVSVYAPIVAAR